MDIFIKGVILVLFAIVVFAKDYYPSEALYWLTYVLMFALIPLWWRAAYWISEKKAKETLNEEIEKTFFVGMVSSNPNDDLIRGRLCITTSEVKLLVKEKSTLKIVWSEKRKNIASVGVGKVVGARKGFVLSTEKNDTGFAYAKAEEVKRTLIG